MRLKDKVVVVTGAASGIGRAIAELFAREGALIVIGDLTEAVREGGEPTRARIERAGGAVRFVPCDVSRWEDVDRLVSVAVETFGSLDVMVNNAAAFADGALLETTEAAWDHVMNVNAKGVFFGCKRAVQQMIGQPVNGDARGRIVNIASQHGMVCAPEMLAYGVSKSAVVYMTRQIAVDYAKHDIICNAVAPGRILTGATSGPGVDTLDYSRMRTPMKRLGRPEDIAHAALFLASDDATYITGHNLLVDGGWMAF